MEYRIAGVLGRKFFQTLEVMAPAASPAQPVFSNPWKISFQTLEPPIKPLPAPPSIRYRPAQERKNALPDQLFDKEKHENKPNVSCLRTTDYKSSIRRWFGSVRKNYG
jgi:hypothetical protein